jgi:Cys-Gly metallodipeptidase DUG1
VSNTGCPPFGLCSLERSLPCDVHLQDWTTQPFRMTSKDGYLHGRGTSDNKGPILAMLFAVKELLDRREGEEGGLAVNLTFIFEGEDEIGSPSLAAIMHEHLHWFNKPKLIVISNSQWVCDNAPCITYGMRGMLCITVRIDGGGRDLHSGNDGGVFNEPMADLCKLLATLVDAQHNILVPGFYDDVDASLLEPALRDIQVTCSLLRLGCARLRSHARWPPVIYDSAAEFLTVAAMCSN